jgi:hypothetical protein|tara:strand:+ start:237 stop:509 length:273 start_codon:yes stop_codon:yes gene_type:complete
LVVILTLLLGPATRQQAVLCQSMGARQKTLLLAVVTSVFAVGLALQSTQKAARAVLFMSPEEQQGDAAPLMSVAVLAFTEDFRRKGWEAT